MPVTNPNQWTPMLWPREWTAPDTLRLIAGSPVDCLVLPAAGDADLWKPLEARAREAGLAVLAATKAGIEAPAAVRIIEDGVWPRVATRGDGDAIDAGPTGLPWIDSNGWRIQLSRALFPDLTPWVCFDLPGKQAVIPASAYRIAAADCEAYGARWLISLDAALTNGLLAGDGAARKTWLDLIGTLSFYRGQAPAGGGSSPAALGALSDYSGENEFLSHEYLNLIAREYVPVRILSKTRGVPPFDGLRMVVYLDPEPLAPAWKAALTEFVRSGGALMTNRGADPGWGAPAAAIPGIDYEVRTFGRGRVAVARDGYEDPWRLAADTHVLSGRANDLLRQSNAGSMSVTFTAAAGGFARLHLVNYSGRPGLDPVTLTFLNRYRRARFRSLENPQPAEIPVAREYERSAAYLPPFSIGATLELEL
jgi:hypothetical protein